jgi:hypothetical protein
VTIFYSQQHLQPRIAIKRLESGYLRAQGNGPCEWAQWREGYLPSDKDFFPEASDKFRLQLRRQLERES